MLARAPQLDLCEVLVQAGHLNPGQAMELRSVLQQDTEQTAFRAKEAGNAVDQTQLGQSSPGLLSPSSAQVPAIPMVSDSSQDATFLGQAPIHQSSHESAAHLSQSSSGEFHIVIPGYEVVKEIGRGGMGAVFLVNQEGSQTPCVAKVMLNADMGEEAYVRFKREAQALAKLSHENIVAVRSFGEINGYPYFIMEHIVGRELKDHVEETLKQSGSAPLVDQVLELLIPVARALTYAHKQGIVHRDLKPANILIEDQTKRPVILDYGLAKSESKDLTESLSNGENLTKTGQALGTPAYMAPEQLDLSSQSGAQRANDVWGFAATLFFALTGRAPYVGPTPINIYNQLLKDSPPPVTVINPQLPLWIEQLCELCFQRDMEQRPTMAAVLEALEKQDSSGLNLKLTKAAKKAKLKKILIVLAVFIALIAVSKSLSNIFDPNKKEFAATLVGDFPETLTSPLLKIRLRPSFTSSETRVTATATHLASKKKTKITLSLSEGDHQGEFIDLKDGRYELIIEAAHGEDQLSIPKTFLVDQTKPSFTKVSITPEGLLSGELSEDQCSLTWNGKSVAVEGRRFQIPLDLLTLGNSGELIVRDFVGHESSLKQRPYHVVRERGLTLSRAEAKAKRGDIIFIHPGRYPCQLTITKALSLVGLTAASEREQLFTHQDLPSSEQWPLLIGEKKPALRLLLKEEGQVIVRGLSFSQESSVDETVTKGMADQDLTQAQLDARRTLEQEQEKKRIKEGKLTLKLSEDEAFRADSRSQQTPIMIEQGGLVLDHCIVSSKAFIQLLCGPRRSWKKAQPSLTATETLFLRGSVLGTVVLGSSAKLDRCVFLERRSPTGDYTRRKAERPFIFKYPALFGVWNRGEATVTNCEFLNSLDRSIFVGQKKGYFPKVQAQIDLRDSFLSGAKSDGLYMGWTAKATVKNCVFEDAIENGVYLKGAWTTLSMSGSLIRRCGFGKLPKYERVPGLFVNGSVLDSEIQDCVVEDCGGAALGLFGAKRFVVKRTRFQRSDAGIFMAKAFVGRLEVSDSEIFENRIAGIHMSQASEKARAGFKKCRIRSKQGEALVYPKLKEALTLDQATKRDSLKN